MLTAHLPSGYILARCIRRPVPYLMPAALIGAILPDLDILWFRLVEHAAVHHHRYWPHIPLIWVAIAAVTLPILRQFGYLHTALVFFAAVFLHLVLDTVAGGILWGYPWDDTLYHFVTIPPIHHSWVVSIVLHWTFLLEIAIWVVAICLWFKARRA
ncbi:MAG: metal-dependent hydrolase [Paracoccaceae bacterium]